MLAQFSFFIAYLLVSIPAGQLIDGVGARSGDRCTGDRLRLASLGSARIAVAVGLCNSIMFPTIFSLAIEGFGLGLALFVPAACYLYIASYGWFARQEVRP